MNVNNQMYTYFEEMVQGYIDGNDDAVERCAKCWMRLNPENPFTYDTPQYEEFFQMQRCFIIWSRGDINQKINRRLMIQHAKALCATNPKQPYVYDKKAEEEEKRIEEQKKKEEQMNQAVTVNDIYTVLKMMNDAYLRRDEVSFQQYAIYLMDIAKINPYSVGMDEYEQFSLMMNYYRKMNKKKLFEAAGKLCDIMNFTEIYPEKKKVVNVEPKTVLGVLPEEKEEKKSWFKFLHPWKKEGEQDDGK